MASYIGTNPPQQTGIVNRFQFTATASQTVFTGADANGDTLFYISSNPTLVFLNGVQLVVNTDYTQTDNETITLATGATVNDEVEIMGFGSFDLNNAATTRSQLGLGTAATKDVGTGANNVVQLNGSSALPAVDGSNLTGINTDVVDDTSPQLGGNLDVNGNDIISVSNADIDIIPNGTGKTNFGGTNGIVLPSGTTAQRVNTNGVVRFNTSLGLAEYFDGTSFKPIDVAPTTTSISPTSLGESVLGSSQTIVLTGSFYATGLAVKIIGTDGTEFTPASTTVNSATQITITTPTTLTNAKEPYTFRVTNPSTLNGVISDALTINATPVFSTAAGSLGTLFDSGRSSANLTPISFSDSDSSPTVSVTSGSLPTGITLNTNGTFSGTADAVGSDTTSTFTVTATDGSETATRQFTITVKPPIALTVSGNIFDGVVSNLTITATNTDGTVNIVFKEGGSTISTLSDQSLDGSNQVTVAVPAAVYGQSQGDTITITVDDGGNISSGVDKTVLAVPTGGSISSSGGFRIHTFNSSSTFAVPSGLTLSNVEYVVVAGGGGVGSRRHSGGGGAGGYRSSVTGENSGRGASAESKQTISAGNYTVTIGGGGSSATAGGNTNSGANNGSNSSFNGITSNGGGRGGTYNTSGASGGCGGAAGSEGGTSTSGGSGTSGQGFDGGDGQNNVGGGQGGGGGGAGANGANGTGSGGNGGSGVASSITGSSVTRAGGGGGGGGTSNAAGSGGSGGGGNGSNSNGSPGSGSANTGGGAGGGGSDGRSNPTGGSGVVIVRYQL